ncbi:peroxiredoxin-4 isoform X1 [Podarcis raffonei]|uniref:peroxiredoxin-4 isoform X1 n=1 Tax=Podarcis raffonei TaxID=65483 RepID=UPI002329586F|nr:peroxiredoxin-4 isoform X1 [Podarcis raffonei]
MEPPRAGTPAECQGAAGSARRPRRLATRPLAVGVLLVLAAVMTEEAATAEAAQGSGDEKCHYYAGGQVYPGEASRVPVRDHSLHLSKAKISEPAPYWEGTAVINGEFKELKLTDFEGKYLVFFFYPLDFTFVCPTEIIAFSDRIEEFRAIGAEVVACSVDSQFTHLAWINTARKQGGLGPIKIPLLSDLTHQISKDYGVYLEDQGHALRGLFIIDGKKNLRQITMNDLPVGRSVDETLRLVQAFQYTDEHGEVCPAGWRPGSETIIPDPAGKLKYFGKVN